MIKNIGKWIITASSPRTLAKCSKCHEYIRDLNVVPTALFLKEHFKYCPHCGSRNEGYEVI